MSSARIRARAGEPRCQGVEDRDEDQRQRRAGEEAADDDDGRQSGNDWLGLDDAACQGIRVMLTKTIPGRTLSERHSGGACCEADTSPGLRIGRVSRSKREMLAKRLVRVLVLATMGAPFQSCG